MKYSGAYIILILLPRPCLASNELGLEVSKKVQYVSVPKGAAKLQLVRVIVFYRINGHLHSLAEHNFEALLVTVTSCTFLETSKPN